jgi:hypothetical protein
MDEEVTAVGDEWTDRRMDDFVGRVERFEGNVKERFDKLDARLDRWGKIVSSGTVAIVAAVIIKVIGV